MTFIICHPARRDGELTRRLRGHHLTLLEIGMHLIENNRPL